MGRLKSVLAPAGSGRWIDQQVDVDLSFGSLVSHGADDVLGGANLCAVECDAGAYELLQFRDAELQSDGSWRLSGLLRGQAGSEAEALSGAAIGARFILINRAVTQPDFPVDLRGLALDWQAGPEEKNPDTDNFVKRLLTVNTRSLMPLSPVHLRVRREGNDLRLTWIRRARENHDSWEGEIGLGEQSERYRLTVFNGANEVRSVETTAPAWLYANADIAADFGANGAGDALTFSVAQISDAVGEGAEAKREVTAG